MYLIHNPLHSKIENISNHLHIFNISYMVQEYTNSFKEYNLNNNYHNFNTHFQQVHIQMDKINNLMNYKMYIYLNIKYIYHLIGNILICILNIWLPYILFVYNLNLIKCIDYFKSNDSLYKLDILYSINVLNFQIQNN